jgi:hypothetical protein
MIGVEVNSEVCVIVGVIVTDGVMVTVGVKVIVGVWVIVGDGGKTRYTIGSAKVLRRIALPAKRIAKRTNLQALPKSSRFFKKKRSLPASRKMRTAVNTITIPAIRRNIKMVLTVV